MDIEEVRQELATAENDAFQAIAEVVKKLQEKTGLRVEAVYVSMEELHTIGRPSWGIVTGVEFDVGLR